VQNSSCSLPANSQGRAPGQASLNHSTICCQRLRLRLLGAAMQMKCSSGSFLLDKAMPMLRRARNRSGAWQAMRRHERPSHPACCCPLSLTEDMMYTFTPVPVASAVNLPSSGSPRWSMRSRCQGTHGCGAGAGTAAAGIALLLLLLLLLPLPLLLPLLPLVVMPSGAPRIVRSEIPRISTPVMPAAFHCCWASWDCANRATTARKICCSHSGVSTVAPSRQV
jgi:hypothetical protein